MSKEEITKALKNIKIRCHPKVVWDDTIDSDLEIIEQALLKAQEPKHYLKWEDLEFDREEQTMKVSLNESIHLLCYYRNMFGSLCMIDNTGITIWEDNKNFFNALHLEVLENDRTRSVK